MSKAPLRNFSRAYIHCVISQSALSGTDFPMTKEGTEAGQNPNPLNLCSSLQMSTFSSGGWLTKLSWLSTTSLLQSWRVPWKEAVRNLQEETNGKQISLKTPSTSASIVWENCDESLILYNTSLHVYLFRSLIEVVSEIHTWQWDKNAESVEVQWCFWNNREFSRRF